MPTWGWPVHPQLSPLGVLWPRKSHWKQKSSPVPATLAFLGQLPPQGPTCKVAQVPGNQRVLSRAVPHLENCTSLLTTLLGWALSASDPRLISVITCEKKQVHRPNGKFQSREDTDATFGNGASTAGTA